MLREQHDREEEALCILSRQSDPAARVSKANTQSSELRVARRLGLTHPLVPVTSG